MSIVFVAGAAGVIGKPLVRLLVQGGHRVFGTTRSKTRAANLERSGVSPIVLDVFDRQAVADAIKGACPDVVIHQLTDLAGGLQPDRIAESRAKTSRLRMEGTQNLVTAARSTGVRRLIAQSIAWIYAPGPLPHREDDPLDPAEDTPQAASAIYGFVQVNRCQTFMSKSPLSPPALKPRSPALPPTYPAPDPSANP